LLIETALNRDELLLMPSITPEDVVIAVTIHRGDPPTISSLKLADRSLLTNKPKEADPELWRIGFKAFTINELMAEISPAWNIPLGRLKINCKRKAEPKAKFRLRDGWGIKWSR
jgi:hypothetical protein